jgi:hypothetical protein
MPIVRCGFNDGRVGQRGRSSDQVWPDDKVNVGFDPTYDAATPMRTPAPGVEGIHVLIDTGAQECCIKQATLGGLGDCA